jgi:putative flippase GtrA
MQLRKWFTSRVAKYSASSILSSAAEEGIFLLLSWWLSDSLSGFMLTLLPLLGARIVSCLINFEINRRLVFQSERSVGVALLLYFLQAIPLAVLQLVLTFGAYWLFDIGEEQIALRGGIYALVMVVLFVVGFLLQKFWVFAAQEKAERA